MTPSPSATTSSASCKSTASSSPSGSGAPEAPVACRSRVSLVLICPSTVIRSKEASQAARSATSGSSTTASVWTKQSIVAMFGSIMPPPFAWAEIVTPSGVRRVQRLGQRSVVRIASEKAAPPSGERLPAASPIPAEHGLDRQRHADHCRSRRPRRPAPADPSAPRRRRTSRSRRRSPRSPVSALALPALTTAARSPATVAALAADPDRRRR